MNLNWIAARFAFDFVPNLCISELTIVGTRAKPSRETIELAAFLIGTGESETEVVEGASYYLADKLGVCGAHILAVPVTVEDLANTTRENLLRRPIPRGILDTGMNMGFKKGCEASFRRVREIAFQSIFNKEMP